MNDVVNLALALMAILTALATAATLTRLPAFSGLAQRRGREATLDGLRGYLALAVFLHHLAVTWQWKATGVWASSPEVYFLNFGKVGVFVFFMITGYLFTGRMLEWKSGPGRWLRLYESRVFRIYPLYLLALALISLVAWAATGFEMQVSGGQLLVDYVKWGLFHGATINGFEETKLVIAQVDWTLKYEWLFYCLLPAIALGLGFRHGGKLLVAAAVVLYALPVQLKQFDTAYLLLFAAGGVAAWLRQAHPGLLRPLAGRGGSAVAVTAIFGALFYPGTMDPLHVIMIWVFFLSVVAGNDFYGLLRLRASIVLGEISYSIYLLHGVVLYLLFTTFDTTGPDAMSMQGFLLLGPALSVLVVLVSAATYYLVERPAMVFGKRQKLTSRLMDRWAAARAVPEKATNAAASPVNG